MLESQSFNYSQEGLHFGDNTEKAEKAKQSFLQLKQKICRTHDVIQQYSNKVKECERLKVEIEIAKKEAEGWKSQHLSNLAKILKLNTVRTELEKKKKELTEEISELEIQKAGNQKHVQQLMCKLEDIEDRHSEKLMTIELQKSELQTKVTDLEKQIKKLHKTCSIKVNEDGKIEKPKRGKKVKSPMKNTSRSAGILCETDVELDRNDVQDFHMPIKKRRLENNSLHDIKNDNELSFTSDDLPNLCDNDTQDDRNILTIPKPVTSDKSVMTDEFYSTKSQVHPLLCDKCETHFESPPLDKIFKVMTAHPPLILEVPPSPVHRQQTKTKSNQPSILNTINTPMENCSDLPSTLEKIQQSLAILEKQVKKVKKDKKYIQNNVPQCSHSVLNKCCGHINDSMNMTNFMPVNMMAAMWNSMMKFREKPTHEGKVIRKKKRKMSSKHKIPLRKNKKRKTRIKSDSWIVESEKSSICDYDEFVESISGKISATLNTSNVAEAYRENIHDMKENDTIADSPMNISVQQLETSDSPTNISNIQLKSPVFSENTSSMQLVSPVSAKIFSNDQSNTPINVMTNQAKTLEPPASISNNQLESICNNQSETQDSPTSLSDIQLETPEPLTSIFSTQLKTPESPKSKFYRSEISYSPIDTSNDQSKSPEPPSILNNHLETLDTPKSASRRKSKTSNLPTTNIILRKTTRNTPTSRKQTNQTNVTFSKNQNNIIRKFQRVNKVMKIVNPDLGITKAADYYKSNENVILPPPPARKKRIARVIREFYDETDVEDSSKTLNDKIDEIKAESTVNSSSEQIQDITPIVPKNAAKSKALNKRECPSKKTAKLLDSTLTNEKNESVIDEVDKNALKTDQIILPQPTQVNDIANTCQQTQIVLTPENSGASPILTNKSITSKNITFSPLKNVHDSVTSTPESPKVCLPEKKIPIILPEINRPNLRKRKLPDIGTGKPTKCLVTSTRKPSASAMIQEGVSNFFTSKRIMTRSMKRCEELQKSIPAPSPTLSNKKSKIPMETNPESPEEILISVKELFVEQKDDTINLNSQLEPHKKLIKNFEPNIEEPVEESNNDEVLKTFGIDENDSPLSPDAVLPSDLMDTNEPYLIPLEMNPVKEEESSNLQIPTYSNEYDSNTKELENEIPPATSSILPLTISKTTSVEIKNEGVEELKSVRTLFNEHLKMVQEMEKENEYSKLKVQAAKKVTEEVIHTVKQEIMRLTNLPDWDDATHQSVVDNLSKINSDRSIIAGILNALDELSLSDKTLVRTHTPPAPLMTISEQKITTIFVSLDKIKPELIATTIKVISYKLFHMGITLESEQIQSFARIFVVLCKLKKDRERVRIMICDAIYSLQAKSILVAHAALTSWPDVLPIYNENSQEHLTICIGYILLNQQSKQEELKNKKLLLRSLFRMYYKFPEGSLTAISLLEKSLEELTKPNYDRSVITVIILLAKKEGIKWSYTNIVKERLLKIIINNNNSSSYDALLLLGYLIKCYPLDDPDKIIHNIVEQLCAILNAGTTSDDIQEGTVMALILISNRHFTYPEIRKSILQWQPRRALSPALKAQLKIFFDSRACRSTGKISKVYTKIAN